MALLNECKLLLKKQEGLEICRPEVCRFGAGPAGSSAFFDVLVCGNGVPWAICFPSTRTNKKPFVQKTKAKLTFTEKNTN